VAIPSFQSYTKKAKTAEAKEILANARTMQAAYQAEMGYYAAKMTSIGWSDSSFKYYGHVTIATASTGKFTARISGNLDSDATIDVWTIDQDGTLSHTTID